MILNVYAIFDKAVKSYSQPVFTQNDILIKRIVTQVLQDPQTDIAKYPDQYTVYHIGVYDNETGQLVDIENNIVCEVISLTTPQKEKA